MHVVSKVANFFPAKRTRLLGLLVGHISLVISDMARMTGRTLESFPAILTEELINVGMQTFSVSCKMCFRGESWKMIKINNKFIAVMQSTHSSRNDCTRADVRLYAGGC